MTDGVVFDIQRYSLHDGPGVRTLVFLKGCPLRCLWCANPESQRREPDILYDAERCTLCLACVRACPTLALSADEHGITRDASQCTACGACVAACPNSVRRISGRWMSVEEVMKTVRRDVPFYRRSRGGMTLGGGEPLAQAAFAEDLLRASHADGIDTAIETTGYADTRVVLSVTEHADHVLYDVKHIDPSRHRELTGVSNQLILDNLRALLHEHPDVTVRYPLVPGYNADDDTLRAFASRIVQMPAVPRVEIIPYHRFGEHKYRLLGRPYTLAGVEPCAPQEAEGACAILRQFGLACTALVH